MAAREIRPRDLVRGASINDLQHSTDLNALRTLHSISAEYAGGPATGTALRTILASAELLRVSACAVVSPESTTIEPEWIERLLRPVYQGNFDFVTPLYRRHKFDGLLMRNLVYPMTRAFYGKRVREPYAAEFCFLRTAGQSFSRAGNLDSRSRSNRHGNCSDHLRHYRRLSAWRNLFLASSPMWTPAPPTWSMPCARPSAPCSGRSNPTFRSGARKADSQTNPHVWARDRKSRSSPFA